jgi:outer membrane immunogenic protein
MNRLFVASALVSVAVACGTPAAFAADLGIAPAVRAPAGFSWTGFYVGGQIGYGWQSGAHNRTVWFPATPDTSSGTGAIYNANGVVGGVHAGWNYQVNSIVLGIETDLELSGISASQSPLTPYAMGVTPVVGVTQPGTARSQAKWLGSLRARAGFAVAPTVLLYATGGLAYGGLEDTVDITGFGTLRTSRTAVGWTAGIGAEWAFAQNWTARLEYRHIDLGSKNTVVSAGTFGLGLATSHRSTLGRFETVRLGVSYRF